MSTATAIGTLKAALDYARSGWPVLPLYPMRDGVCSCPQWMKDQEKCKPGKHPLSSLVPNGKNDASTDEATISAWWSQWPDAGVGIVCGPKSFFVLDVDPRAGGDLNLGDLETRHGPLPETVESLTGGGGRHILFADPGVDISAKELMPGVELKCSDKGYIVAPPTVHESGASYQWRPGFGVDEIALARVPAWVLEMLAKRNGKPPERREGASETTYGPNQPGGSRHNRLISLAGSMRYRGMSEGAILAALMEENTATCVPPKAEQEIRDMARWTGKREPGPSRVGTEAVGSVVPAIPYVDLEAIAKQGVPPLVYYVDGWLVVGDIALFVGPAYCGKTTTAYALGVGLAMGEDVFGLRVLRACRVLIVDEEQGSADSSRTLIRLGAPHPNLRLLSAAGISLATEAGLALLEAALEDFQPDVVVLDSATQIFALRNENDAAEVGQRFGILFRLRDKYGTTFILIHHKPKDIPGGPSRAPIDRARGSTVFTTQSSTVWNLTGVSREAVDLSQAKRRGARLAPTLRIRYAEDPDGRIRLMGELQDEDTEMEKLADDVLDYLAGQEEARTAEIVNAISRPPERSPGAHRRALNRALQYLLELGHVEKPSRGIYRRKDRNEEQGGAE